MLAASMRTLVLLSVVSGILGLPKPLNAQQGGSSEKRPSDRIQRLAEQRDTGAARRLVDSVLAATPTPDPRYGEALYWRAVLGSSRDSVRQDLLRFVVEFPLSAQVEDALVRLADGELRYGDRDAARRHLERLVRGHLTSDRGARAAQLLTQMMFDDGAIIDGCAVLDSARAHVSAGNVELSNQLAYSGRRCTVERGTSTAAPDTIRKEQPDSTEVHSGTTSSGRWSVQVAAYGVRADALRLAARLRSRGYDTRVTPDRPFRVRIGRFATRTTAGKVVNRLKAEKTAAIIVEAERP